MTIDKAIEILSRATEDCGMIPLEDYTAVIKLGIEALKSVRTGRKVGLHYEAKYLPGETED